MISRGEVFPLTAYQEIEERMHVKPLSTTFTISTEEASKILMQWSDAFAQLPPEKFSPFFREQWNQFSEEQQNRMRSRMISALEFLLKRIQQEGIRPTIILSQLESLFALMEVPEEIGKIIVPRMASDIQTSLKFTPLESEVQKKQPPTLFQKFLQQNVSEKRKIPRQILIWLVVLGYIFLFWIGWAWLKEPGKSVSSAFTLRRFQFLSVCCLLLMFFGWVVAHKWNIPTHFTVLGGLMLFGLTVLNSIERTLLFLLGSGILFSYWLLPGWIFPAEILLALVFGILPARKFSRLWWLWGGVYSAFISAIATGSQHAVQDFFLLVSGLVVLVLLLRWMNDEFFVAIPRRRLVELTNPEFPLLKELAEKAPGTYSHSLNVAALAEAGAKAIQANAYLVRVGALYHDIGKISRPQFFVENFTQGSNPHKEIPPALSARIIIAHVPEGLALAKKHQLPEMIQRFILTHHAEGKVEGVEASGDEEAGQDLRYAGERPVTKEEVLLLLADGIEAISRSLQEVTREALQEATQRMLLRKIADGVLQEAQVQMDEIHKAVRAMTDFIATNWHRRTPYSGS